MGSSIKNLELNLFKEYYSVTKAYWLRIVGLKMLQRIELLINGNVGLGLGANNKVHGSFLNILIHSLIQMIW